MFLIPVTHTGMVFSLNKYAFLHIINHYTTLSKPFLTISHRCNPHCDEPCVNGVCSGPNLCLCNPGMCHWSILFLYLIVYRFILLLYWATLLGSIEKSILFDTGEFAVSVKVKSLNHYSLPIIKNHEKNKLNSVTETSMHWYSRLRSYKDFIVSLHFRHSHKISYKMSHIVFVRLINISIPLTGYKKDRSAKGQRCSPIAWTSTMHSTYILLYKLFELFNPTISNSLCVYIKNEIIADLLNK